MSANKRILLLYPLKDVTTKSNAHQVNQPKWEFLDIPILGMYCYPIIGAVNTFYATGRPNQTGRFQAITR